MYNNAKDGESNAPGNNQNQQGPQQEHTPPQALRQTHSKGRHGTHHPGAGLLAAMELGGSTAFHISALDILAGPWRHTADSAAGHYLHAGSRSQAKVRL
jgi:hypothetical protein